MSEEITVTIDTTKIDDYQRVSQLCARTDKEKAKREDVEALKIEFAKHPELWQVAGDLTRRAANRLVDELLSTAFIKEAARFGMDERRKELGYDEAAPLERMLIERVVICGMYLDLLQMTVITKQKESHSTETGLYWDRRMANATRRFERAVESLAKVRMMTAATRLIESRTEAQAARGGGNLRLLKMANAS